MKYWMVKQEPEAYSWGMLQKEGRTAWTGVRNFQARNNLQEMKKGDPVLFYHSVSEKQVVGVAQVCREHYPDPSATEGDWVCVDLEPVYTLPNPVPLATIKEDKALSKIALVRQGRLSVMPLSKQEYDRILKLGGKKR